MAHAAISKAWNSHSNQGAMDLPPILGYHSPAMIRHPLVGLPSDTYESNLLLFHSLGDKYVRAVSDVAQCLPVMIPAIAEAMDLSALLDHFDGILMTGAVSNVHPPHYGDTPTADQQPYDHHRDQLTLTLIRAVLDRGIPLFCVCPRFHELHV